MSTLKNMSVKAKMLLSFSLILIFTIIVEITAVSGNLSSNNTAYKIERLFDVSFSRIARTHSALNNFDTFIVNYFANVDDVRHTMSHEEFERNVIAKEKEILDAVNDMNENRMGAERSTSKYAGIISELKKVTNEYVHSLETDTKPVFKGDDITEAFLIYAKVTRPYYIKARDLFTSASIEQTKRGAFLARESADPTIMYLGLGITIAAIILSLIISLSMTKYITKQLGIQKKSLTHMSNGNFAFEIKKTSEDDFGSTMDVLEKMRDSLNQSLTMIIANADKSHQILDNVRDRMINVNSGSQEAESQSITVAAASNEMVSTTSEIAHNCELASTS